MARQQVLSSIHQNQVRGMHNNPPTTTTTFNSKKHPSITQQNNRMRSASLSSLSSVSSIASSSRERMSTKANTLSLSASPDENKAKKERKHFVEMFSPVRVIRAARAGMKRKRGGSLAMTTNRSSAAFQRGINQNRSLNVEGKRPAVDQKRTIRRSRRTESRDASNASLHSGMKAMVLTDNDSEVVALPGGGIGNRRVSATGSVRSTRSRLLNRGREDSEDEFADDAEEDERLLSQAPSWQLHRLKKTKLFKLHVMLGTWQQGEEVDLDLYNKHELVEGLVKSRSSSIVSRSAALHSEEAQINQISPLPTSKASLKRSTLSNAHLSMSSAYTDEEESASEAEANDAGGEETEAEPMKSAKRRQDVRMSRLYGNQNVASPMVNRLRKARPRNVNSGQEMFLSREGQTKTSTSSSISSPMGKRMFPTGSTLFTASSPARTRLRTHNQSTSSLLRLSLPANRSTAARDVFPRRNEQQQTPRRKRGGAATGRSVNFRKGLDQEAREADSDDQLEWEDASPTSLQRYTMHPPRKAKIRAQEQLLHLNGKGQQEDDGEISMSVDETPTKANLRLLSGSADQLREMDSGSDLSSDDGTEEIQWDEESHASETDIQASPSKMRKLRNGKIRLLAVEAAINKLDEEEEEDTDDVEMGEVEDIVEVGDDPMSTPTSSSLNKLKRSKLIQLCERNDIIIARDATKAALIEALLSSHPIGEAPDSSQTQKADSTASNKTTGPESGSRRGRRNTSRQQNSLRLSDKPLLLRSHSNEVQMSKPPSPIPAGEEELNGLDLESLNLTDKEIAFNKLEKLEKIGSGGFKDVYIGKYHISKKSTKRVAISDIRDQLSEMDIKELGLLRDLKHENIVRFIGVCIPPPDLKLVQCMIVSELCSNGDLFDYIRNVPAPADEEIFRIMLETARGLEYLHTRTPAIIHRDCKSTNVLVTRNRTAKINDFGLARVRNTKRSMIKSLVGTVNWQAVELWSPKPNYNEKVDVWSAAMTFWETLQWHQPEKKYPFQEMNEHQIYLDVGHKKLRPSTVSIRRNYGGEIVDLLDEMWNHNAKERPTMTEVCQRLEILIVQKKQTSKIKTTLTKNSR